MDYTRATELTPEVEKTIEDAFTYHPWTEEQVKRGVLVREALANGVKAIIANVPPGPDRTTAIRKIREARMDANSAITHGLTLTATLLSEAGANVAPAAPDANEEADPGA